MPPDREEFKPHPMNVAQEMAMEVHHRRVTALSAVGALPHDWRDWLVYDVSDCRHTAMSMIEVKNAHGIWVVEICVACGQQVSRTCAHVRCDWHLDGKVLRCANCGVDGT